MVVLMVGLLSSSESVDILDQCWLGVSKCKIKCLFSFLYFMTYLLEQLLCLMCKISQSKIADLGKYQITTDIASHFKNLITRQRQDITGHGQHLSPSGILGDGKNPNDIFIDLDVAIEFAAQSKKPKIVALVKWLIKKEVEKKQKGHHQQGTQLQPAITQ